ncbi:MAG TPA: nucleotidyltransferase family protein, partial [Candidatus Acidoferrales bacterium]|nr:nucleotidyltransferase family protein [Candidatus Acidoferrales bacterium]
AVAMAGGLLEADFREAGYDVPNKAYLRIAGELMLVRVLRALRASSSIGQIRCVTPASAAALGPAVVQLSDMLVEPGPDLISSALAGFAGLPDEERVIIAATDMPLLTASAVDGFATLAAHTPCDVGYGFVERQNHDRLYPGVRHTWVRLREGTFCGGGMSVIRAGAAVQIEPVLRNFAEARKSPAKLASLFSPGLVLKVLMGQLSIAEVERRADQLTGLVCRGILCRDPEVAVNVDCLEDLRTVEALLRKTAS